MREFKKLPLELFIGYDIEQNSRVIELDASEMVEQYPSGILQLVCKRPGEETTYIAPSFEQDGGTLRWTLTSYDVEKAGQGLAIVALVDTSEESVKVLASHKIRTGIEEGLHFRDAETVDPEDSLIARVLAAVSQAQAYAQDASENADRAEAVLDDVDDAKDQAISDIETKGQETLDSIPSDYTALSGDVYNLKSNFENNIGQWYFTKSVSGSRYPYLQLNDFGNRVYFELIEPLECVYVYVNGSNDNWQTQTLLHTQTVALEGYSYYVDVPAGYTSLRFAVAMESAYTGNISAIIHTVDNHTISQNVIDLSKRIGDLETDIEKNLSVIGDKLSGTNFNKFYLNSNPYQGIRTLNNTDFNLKQYSVEGGKAYYLFGRGVSLYASLPVSAFGTAEIVDKNNYIEKILDGSTVGTDYFVSYVPQSDGYIYVAWVTGKAELEVYESIPIVDAVNTLITESEKKDVKIQLFGDSITDNQWGDNTTWANYIQQMMPDYTVTVVNDAVGGSGIGHGKSTTTESHQTEEYNYVWDLVTNGTTLQTDADAVVILVGTNNWASSSDVGDMSSTGYGTIYGALKGIIEYISTHSAATVFVCTVPQRYNSADQSKPTNSSGEPLDNNGVSLAEFCVPFEKVSAFYGMPCIRLNSSLGWNRLNISNFTSDGLHPNAKGDLMLAKFICAELMKHI